MSTRNIGSDGRAVVGGDHLPPQRNTNQVTGAPIIAPRPISLGEPRGVPTQNIQIIAPAPISQSVMQVGERVLPGSGYVHNQPRPPINSGRDVVTETNYRNLSTGAPRPYNCPPRENGTRAQVGSEVRK